MDLYSLIAIVELIASALLFGLLAAGIVVLMAERGRRKRQRQRRRAKKE